MFRRTEKILEKMEARIRSIEYTLRKQGCAPEACSVCRHGRNAIDKSGDFVVVCEKTMTASCAGFEPRRPEDLIPGDHGGDENLRQAALQSLQRLWEVE